MKGLWLEPIPPAFRQEAVEALDRGDWFGFLIKAESNQYHLDLVVHNVLALRERGLYEPALLGALRSTRTNNHHCSLDTLRWLLYLADRDRLRQAGALLPGAGPFTLYRGVAGRGAARRIRGVSWTLSFETAKWFAMRFAMLLPWATQLAVFQIVIDAKAVLAYVTDRSEEEFLVLLRPDDKVTRVWTKEHGSRQDKVVTDAEDHKMTDCSNGATAEGEAR
jgi:hypothetical protein